MSYEDRLVNLGRGLWLGDPMSAAMLGRMGAELDEVSAQGLLALRYTRLDQCPADGLDAHAFTSALPRVHGESTAQLLLVLLGRWSRFSAMGTDEGLYAQLARMGYPRCRWIGYPDLMVLGMPPTVFGGNQGFGLLDIDGPNGFGPPALWDSAGPLWDDGVTRWDLSEPYVGAIDDLKATIRRWKPVGVSCRFLRIRIGEGWVTVPVGEEWEFDERGAATDYYLTHW